MDIIETPEEELGEEPEAVEYAGDGGGKAIFGGS